MGHKVKLPDREYEISYRTVPNWFAPAVSVITFSAAIVAIFGAAPYLLPSLPIARGILLSQALVLETFLRCVVLLLLGFLTFLLSEAARHDSLVISKEGMSFPVLLAPDLLFRRKRRWDDIANILIGSMLLSDRKGTYEYELENSKDKAKLFIYFKSGGHVALDLKRMSKKNVDKLFGCLETWCMSMSRSPQMRDAPGRLLEVKRSEEALSYTRLWEEQLERNFSATNFVPLEKGAAVNGGRLKVLMQLASGGLSAIYLAEQQNKELAVVKEAVLPPSVDETLRAKASEMFRREAHILTQLSHPQIARVLDHFSENGRDYLVIEFVAGHTLRQLVAKRGPLSEDDVVEYARQLTDIIDYLHSQEPPVVHRDISPDNILLRDDGRVVLIDFGAANQYVGTATGTLVGRQAYIAPEQLRGKACPASDFYALGGTLSFLLTGKDPTPLAVSHPVSDAPRVSEQLDATVARLTAFDVKQRLSSAQELYEFLTDASCADASGAGRLSAAGDKSS